MHAAHSNAPAQVLDTVVRIVQILLDVRNNLLHELALGRIDLHLAVVIIDLTPVILQQVVLGRNHLRYLAAQQFYGYRLGEELVHTYFGTLAHRTLVIQRSQNYHRSLVGHGIGLYLAAKFQAIAFRLYLQIGDYHISSPCQHLGPGLLGIRMAFDVIFIAELPYEIIQKFLVLVHDHYLPHILPRSLRNRRRTLLLRACVPSGNRLLRFSPEYGSVLRRRNLIHPQVPASQRQSHRKPHAIARVLRPYLSVMKLHQLPADIQPNARAMAVGNLLRAIEHIEHMGHVFIRNMLTLILDPYLHIAWDPLLEQACVGYRVRNRNHYLRVLRTELV